MTKKQLQLLAKQHGTPLVIVDHDEIRRNYAEFRRYLPQVQCYFAVKANAEPAIVRTLYKAGASFDVASLPEFMLVYENIKMLPAKARQDFIWDKIIYANPIKPRETLCALDQYKPLVTFDNLAELQKIRQYAPHAGVVVRLGVANTGSQCELSNKFGCPPGEAVDLIVAAFKLGLVVEGLSFHVGSQCTNFENFVQALNAAAAVMKEARERGHELKILDIGGGFPAPTTNTSAPSANSPASSTRKSTVCSPRIFRFSPSRAVFWSQPQPRPSPASLAKRCATANAATTLTTASITLSAELSLITASIRCRRSSRAKRRSVQFLARPATGWIASRNPSCCQNLQSKTWFTPKKSARMGVLRQLTSTVSRRRKLSTSTSNAMGWRAHRQNMSHA